MSTLEQLIAKHASPTYYNFGKTFGHLRNDEEYFCLGDKIFHSNPNGLRKYFDLTNADDMVAGKELFEKLVKAEPTELFGNTPFIQHAFFMKGVERSTQQLGFDSNMTDSDIQRLKDGAKQVRIICSAAEIARVRANLKEGETPSFVFDMQKYHGDNFKEEHLLELINTWSPGSPKNGANDIFLSANIERFGGYLKSSTMKLTEPLSQFLALYSFYGGSNNKDILLTMEENSHGELMLRMQYQTMASGYCISNLDKYPAVIELIEQKIEEHNLYGSRYQPEPRKAPKP